MKIRPLADRIVVKRLDAETKSKGGIIIPDTAKEKPIEGEVLAIGSGKIAQSRSQEFRTDGLDSRSFLDVMLQEFVEGVGLGEMFFEKAAVRLVADSREQRADGRLDVAHQR